MAEEEQDPIDAPDVDAIDLLPEDMDTCRITGRWVDISGRPVAGVVTLRPRVARLVSTGTATVVLPIPPIRAELNEIGEIDIRVPATDDPDISPVDWTYDVREEFVPGGGLRYSIEAPAGGHVDLSEVVEVEPSTGTTIIRGPKGDPGPPGEPGPPGLIDGDQTIAGIKTFTASPVVPIPAGPDEPASAVSVGEVDDMLAGLPTLLPSPDGRVTVTEHGADLQLGLSHEVARTRHLSTANILGTVTNTTTETSLLSLLPGGDGPPTVGPSTLGSTWRLTAGGSARNESGSPVDVTWRLRRTTGVLVEATFTLASGAGFRSWHLDLAGSTNPSLADGLHGTGLFVLEAGVSDEQQLRVLNLGAGQGMGTSEQTWDLTVQFSVALPDTTVIATTAVLTETLAPA